MRIDREAKAVHYRHVRGITAGMDVVWQIEPANGGTEVTIVHDWSGPRWPLIGPVFMHGIASWTLAGIAKAVGG
jgi:aromatase